MQTYQGIDRCGDRLAEEVRAYVEEHPALQRISVVGHSMGGLIARYALGDPPFCSKACQLLREVCLMAFTPSVQCCWPVLEFQGDKKHFCSLH